MDKLMRQCAALLRPGQANKKYQAVKAPVAYVASDILEAALAQDQAISNSFAEIIAELSRYQQELGGLQNFSSQPHLSHKIKQKDFRSSYTDYEYIYLTVLGFDKLQRHCKEIVRKSNGDHFTTNPGTRMLEDVCGMTMHGNRSGSNSILQSAASTLEQAFQVSQRKGELQRFFREAFDRNSDPCLEGRVETLLRYLEASELGDMTASPPWEDVSLRKLSLSASYRDIVGEHLRTFVNECTWKWSREASLTYSAAKETQMEDTNPGDFQRFYNASTFESALRSRGVTFEQGASQWEVMTDSGDWQKYEPLAQSKINEATQSGLYKLELKLGPKNWTYELDLDTSTQRNPQTGRERPIRYEHIFVKPTGTISEEEVRSAIAFFVEMATLPVAPCPAPATSFV